MSKVMTALTTWMTIGLFAGVAMAGACSIEVSPLTLELQIDAGRAHTGTIQITNTAEATEHVRAYCQDWALKPDGVVVFVAAGQLPGSASAWVQLMPAEFDLAPNQTQQVRYTIRVPADVAGEARTVVVFEAGAREVSVGGAPARLVPRIGTIVYVQCGPQRPSRARVVEFSVGREGGSLAIQNAGASHLRFTGHVEIRARGRLVRRRDVNPFVVLPAPFNMSRVALNPDVLAGLPAGHYEVTAVLDHGGSSLLGARTEVDLGPEPPIVIAKEE